LGFLLGQQKICVFTVTCWKKIGLVGFIYLFFNFEIQWVWVIEVTIIPKDAAQTLEHIIRYSNKCEKIDTLRVIFTII
jgi:hypothetical protein